MLTLFETCAHATQVGSMFNCRRAARVLFFSATAVYIFPFDNSEGWRATRGRIDDRTILFSRLRTAQNCVLLLYVHVRAARVFIRVMCLRQNVRKYIRYGNSTRWLRINEFKRYRTEYIKYYSWAFSPSKTVVSKTVFIALSNVRCFRNSRLSAIEQKPID